MDDLKGVRIGVVDRHLLGGERVIEHLDLDARIGERARRVEAQGFEIARQDLHGGQAAVLHRGDEIGARGER